MASRSTHTPRGLSEQPPPTGDWFREFLSPAGIDSVAGIWLLLAPFALVYRAADPSINDIAVGVVIAAAGFIRLGVAMTARTLTVINAATAIWLLIAAAWLDQSARAAGNDIAIAMILGVLALAGAVVSRDGR
jgi:hypothetical protein